MSESYNKLVKTLKSIFEMDKADLDFGIYRIMNQKRDDMMRFLEEDLLSQVKDAFADYVTDGQTDLQQELNAAIEQARQFGAPDPEQTPAVKEIRQKMASTVNIRSVEHEVYSHLHKFFSRYYDKGDFISQRRYKNDAYAIPYEGEEVKLYWANHDQYYIKSSEHLRDYAFLVQEEDSEKNIRIKLVEADTEKDNVKAKIGEDRRFVLDEDNPLSIEGDELHIHFHYIPVGKKKQEKLNAEAVKLIFEQEGYDEWLDLLREKAPTEKNPSRTLLEKHLNDYTARNTFDYFIHKDLGGFLKRELDFYIKNEVFHLDDIDDAAFEVTEQHLRKIKVLRTIAHKIIRMLAQLENFQKKLWLKKKFVVETNYCITIDRLADHTDLLAQVFENEEQIVEWEGLFALDLEKLEQDYENMDWEEFLSQPEYQHLVMDTKFFDQEFKDELIGTIDCLDESLDGLLINSENFQALSLIQKKYQSNIDLIYIDPPYNTSASEILYKNNYKHSSWLSLMQTRLKLGKELLNSSAMHCVAIDDVEAKDLSRILEDMFGKEMSAGVLPIKINPSGRPTEKGFALTHEYTLFHRNSRDAGISKVPRSNEQLSRFDQEDSEGIFEWRNLRREGSNSDRSDGQRQYYPIYANLETGTIRVPLMEWIEESREWIVLEENKDGEEIIWPVNDTGREKNWRWSEENLRKDYMQFLARVPRNGTPQVYYKYRPNTEGVTPLTMWTDSRFSATEHGTKLLKKMFKSPEFTYPKSIYAVEECLSVTGFKKKQGVVLDYFAGSGTTGHAVININRIDSRHRKFILCEMGKHFQGTLIPRLKKAGYSEVWKDGEPKLNSKGEYKSISQCIKYVCLESYEDALNNLVIKEKSQQQNSLLTSHAEFREDYMLEYALDVEVSDSSSLLNIEQFKDPFNYKLNIGSGSVGATKPVTVDLVETFNYLIGLSVKHIDTLRGFKIVTGTNQQDESVLIIWRNVNEQDNAALEAFMDKQGYNPKDTEYAHIYVNGDHTLEDPFSKVKMTEIEFKRLMFDVQDV